jgi:hypothetical protein
MRELIRIQNPKGEGFLWLALDAFNAEEHELFEGLQVIVPAGDYLTTAELQNAINAAIAAATPAPKPSKKAAEGGAGDTTPGAIATVNSTEAIALVSEASLEQLDELEKAERANQKNEGGRKGVLKAIEERRAALKKAPEGGAE